MIIFSQEAPLTVVVFREVLKFQNEMEFGNVGFWGEGKTGVPREKPLGARTRTNNKLNPHMTPSAGIDPGPHWWEARGKRYGEKSIEFEGKIRNDFSITISLQGWTFL